MHLVEHRQEVEREAGVVGPALHGVEDAADDDDPPAVEDAAGALGEPSPHTVPTMAALITCVSFCDARVIVASERLCYARHTHPTSAGGLRCGDGFCGWRR